MCPGKIKVGTWGRDPEFKSLPKSPDSGCDQQSTCDGKIPANSEQALVFRNDQI